MKHHDTGFPSEDLTPRSVHCHSSLHHLQRRKMLTPERLTMVTMGVNLSARLFGWSAADWSRPATNKFIGSKKKKKSIVLLKKEIINKLVVDLLQQKSLGCWKVLKKRCKQKGKMFPQLTNSLDGLDKIKEHAPRSEHVHLHQDIGHIRKNHLQVTLLPQLSKYAHASGIYLYCA